MTDEEAPIAIEEAIVPPASNGSSATDVRDRKLSVVSKHFDVNNDGELDDAEQASKYCMFFFMLIDVRATAVWSSRE